MAGNAPPSSTRAGGAATAFALVIAAMFGAPSHADEPRPLPVAVTQIEMVSGATISELYPGLAQARRDSLLGFESGGRVADVRVDVGDRVEAGDALASLDMRSLDALIAAAGAQVAEAEASLRLARATAGRQGELVERGHSSQQSLDESRSSVAVAEGRLAAASAQLDELEVRRDLAVLTAPYDGVITERLLDEGAIAAPGAPVLEIVEADAVEIRVGVPLAHARDLVVGQVYDLQVDGEAARARLRATTGVVDRGSQTVTAVFDVIEGDVTPGEVVRIALRARVEGEGAWAPITALSEDRRGLWNVLALTEPSGGAYRLESRIVDVLYTEAERVYVRGAIADGDLIVAAGRDRVVEGARVTPVSNGETTALARAEQP